MIVKGVISLTTNVNYTSIQPHADFGLSMGTSFALEKVNDKKTTAVRLRPQDRVVFGQHSLEITIEQASPSKARATPDAVASRIEVRSSGVDDSAEIAGSDTDSDDDDSLNKTKESQATAAPFSTAHSTLPAVQETPKVQRSMIMAEDGSGTSAPPAPPVLTASHSASNRGRKRASREVEESPDAGKNVSAP